MVTVKRIWNFIWHDDSIWSWLVNIALAFIIVKFILYPLIGLLLGTSYPVVAVMSGSMEHDGNFDQWWESQNKLYEELKITKEQFKTFKFMNGFNKGDIIILTKAKDIQIGDVIVFSANTAEPIIHRVVKTENGIQTKGDHNLGSRQDEVNIDQTKILGKALFRVPYLGWLKLGFVSLIQ